MKNLFDLTGKIALLIGYDGNFGPIFSETLKEAGALAVTVGLPETDISERNDIEDAVNECINRVGVPDIVICNAAIDIPPKQTDARFFTKLKQILQVNLISYARFAELLIPEMDGGVFVFIGSIQGYIGADWRNYSGGFEKPVGYNLSKAALQQFARSITVQYGRKGIRAVCPGFGPYLGEKLAGPFADKIKQAIPTGKGVGEEDLKRTLLYACTCEGLAGEDWLVDGGYTKW